VWAGEWVVAKGYSDETKAAALAELATGSSVTAVAQQFGVSRRAIQLWRDAAHLPKLAPATQEKRADLGERLYDYLDASLVALRSQLDVFGDPVWLKEQNAHDLGILHGIIADKTGRLLAAVRPGGAGDGAGDADPGDGGAAIDA
jgi:transposase-like protein